MKKGKKTMTIYMDNVGVYYTVQGKGSDFSGKTIFKPEDKDSYGNRLKVLRRETKEIKARLKVKSINYVMQEGIRMVKVFRFDKAVPLNNDTELFLRDEVAKYLQPSENINEYEIKYLKTGKKTQSVFLTALVKKKEITEYCNFAKMDNLPLDRIMIPEEQMFEMLKDAYGVRAVVLYDEQLFELRVLVVNGSDFIYANQSPNIYASDIQTEILNIIDYIRAKFKLDVVEVLVLGVDSQYIAENDRIKCMGLDSTESKERFLKGE